MNAINHGLSRFDQLNKVCIAGDAPEDRPLPRTLGRLLPANPVSITHISHQDVIDALDALTSTMETNEIAEGPAEAGMTFLGQFIDHDVTLDATSELGRRIDPATIPNVRTPALDLDCVYGAGPEASPHLYGRHASENYLVHGRDDNHRDLARTCNGRALIGDPRNDENIIVAQIQSAFIDLHNILMDRMAENGEAAADVAECAHMGTDKAMWERYVPERLTSFAEVRRFMRLHYQWVIWNEFLPAFVDQACLDAAWDHDHFGADAPVMPVEFTGACYRFGHATTQPTYRLKSGQGARDLFDVRGFDKRPEDGNLDMDQFFSIHGSVPQKARPVGTKMGGPLFRLPFVESAIELPEIGPNLDLDQSKNLALRNMVRDRYTYQLASGQMAADHLHIHQRPHIPEPLKAKGFDKTPLWFYALQEAAEFGGGRLTGVGGTIVASVFARLLRLDPTSVAHVPHFKPWSGFKHEQTILAGMLNFAEEHRDHISVAAELRCG